MNRVHMINFEFVSDQNTARAIGIIQRNFIFAVQSNIDYRPASTDHAQGMRCLMMRVLQHHHVRLLLVEPRKTEDQSQFKAPR